MSDAQPYTREEFRVEDVSRRIMVDVAASKVIVPLDIWSRICDTFNAAVAVERGVRERSDTERLDWLSGEGDTWIVPSVNGFVVRRGDEHDDDSAEFPTLREAIDAARGISTTPGIASEKSRTAEHCGIVMPEKLLPMDWRFGDAPTCTLDVGHDGLHRDQTFKDVTWARSEGAPTGRADGSNG